MSLQHLGTLLLMAPLAYDCIKNRMPMAAFASLALFAAVHIVGARWCYSNVPYLDWCESLSTYLHDLLYSKRNHYDRLVHFSFGLLLFPYLLYVTGKLIKRQPLAAVFVAWLLVQTSSMIYELFEWQLSVFMSEGISKSYNGQQGDSWDAQKDMALAMIGSTIAAAYYAIKAWRTGIKKRQQ